MQVRSIQHMLNFQYSKSASEIVARVKIKIEGLRAKITERESRIASIQESNKITKDMLIDLLLQARKQTRADGFYSVSNSVGARGGGGKAMTEESVSIPAGVVNQLMTEMDSVSSEREQIHKLGLIERNLTDYTDHKTGKTFCPSITQEDLEYLGF